MSKFRKKPVEIEAHQWDGTPESAAAIVRWVLANGGRAHYETTGMQDGHIVITTLEGDMRGGPGWWYIQGVKGEFYPCKPDIFDQSYEAVAS
jgi:hypothetical protein